MHLLLWISFIFRHNKFNMRELCWLVAHPKINENERNKITSLHTHGRSIRAVPEMKMCNMFHHNMNYIMMRVLSNTFTFWHIQCKGIKKVFSHFLVFPCMQPSVILNSSDIRFEDATNLILLILLVRMNMLLFSRTSHSTWWSSWIILMFCC